LKAALLFLLLNCLAAEQLQAQSSQPAPAGVAANVRIAETRTYNEIIRTLSEKKIYFQEQDLMTDYGAYGASIEVPLQAPVDTKKIFVLALPVTSARNNGLDGGYTTANTTLNTPLSWGQELALNFIDIVLSEAPSFNTLVYFAGDNWPAPVSYPYAGIQALLNQSRRLKDAVVMYCDFTNPPEAIQIMKGKDQAAAPLSLVSPFIKRCAENDIPCFFNPAATEIDNFIAASGVPVLYCDGEAPALFTLLQTNSKISAAAAAKFVYEYAADAMMNTNNSENADRNYAYIGFKSKNIFIPEYTLILFTLFASVFVCFLCFYLYFTAKSGLKRLLISVFTLVLFLSLLSFAVLHITGKNARPIRKHPHAEAEGLYDNIERYFTAKAEFTRLLERATVKINIKSLQAPLHYRLFFTRHEEGQPEEQTEIPAYFIYDAPMPYEIDGRRVEFTLGSYPPAQLNIEISLPRSLNGTFTIEAIFEDGARLVQNLLNVAPAY
jgi:hypothetical protein